MPEPLPGTHLMLAMPHNIEAEQAILGALLLSEQNAIYDDIGSTIGTDDFYDPVHGVIWATSEAKIKAGTIATPVTIKTALADHAGLAELGGIDYLTRMMDAVTSIRATIAYAELLRDLSRRRVALQALQSASADLVSETPVEDVLGALDSALSVSDQRGPADAVTFAEAVNRSVVRMNDAYNGSGMPGMSLGIPEVDAAMGHLLPGELLLIGARPSMGKSALSIDIARRVAQKGAGCVYWCGEMMAEDNAERVIASEAARNGTRVSYHLARQGKMHEEQFKALLEAARDIEQLPIMVIDPAIKQLERLCHAIRRHVKRLRRKNEECIVIVDYLQQISVTKASRFEVVTEVSQQLKALAVELRVPMIVLSQLSRKVEERDDKRPRLSDLRESGQLEQDANVIWFLYREDYYLERAIDGIKDEVEISKAVQRLDGVRGQMDIITAKQRSGPLNTVTLQFDGATNSFTSVNAEDGQEGFI